MWELAFEESMLNTYENLIIHCPSKDLAEDLMEILEQNGVMWCSNDPPTSNARWYKNTEGTCYWVESKSLCYSGKQYAEEDPDGEYEGYIRCTFYGVESPDFDIASDDEILEFLCIGGE